ncbi:MAG: SDR family NAD(P)-dependent oxidoreductase [Candidatus Latescibacteria bacterium]|nr:SDR family NAD(P)-dependent oxidoreductase [Candidatus Latescibacterota bacterium]
MALILGGSRGIGGGITESFARCGARVVFTHTGNTAYSERLDAMLEALRAEGCDVTAAVSDARSPAEVSQTARQVLDDLGAIDILVVNVGQNTAGPAEERSDEAWLDAVQINLSAVFYGVRAVLPAMVEAGSREI